MLQYEELRLQLLGHEAALKDLADALGLSKMKQEIAELEKKTAENGFCKFFILSIIMSIRQHKILFWIIKHIF